MKRLTIFFEFLQKIGFRLRFNPRDNQFRRIALRERAALIGQGFVAPDTNLIWGPDISDWDGNVNLSVTKEYGAKFFIAKCMDGTVPSKYFAANLQRGKALHRACGDPAAHSAGANGFPLLPD